MTASAMLLFSPAAFAQPAPSRQEPDAFINQQRAVEERILQEFDKELGISAKAAFDWGGWYSVYGFLFDDGVESSRTLRRHDLRLWGRLSLDQGAHEFYVRGRLSYLHFNSGDSYSGNDSDWEGPNLERGYYRFDLARAVRASGGESIAYNVVITAGRDLVRFGNGLALATPLDHVAIETSYKGWELTTLAGKTVGSSPEFDLSRTATRTRRSFLGGQLKYRGFERHEPFMYVLWQRDRNSEEVPRLLQGFDYDSFYFGLGSAGELARRWRYAAEWVLERGHSFGDRQFRNRNDIRAWALSAELEYLFPGKHRGRASVEYLVGSGDSNRPLSPTNTVGGHAGGFTDESYIGFGYRDTGLAFAPRYSNLHMWRAGTSFYPWPERGRLSRLELGSDWYLYHKHHRSGGVSDPTADVGSGFLGWEMDYYANWRVAADLSWTARFGVFFPGDAFSDQTTRTFLLLGMTWSF
jgi:hypothetical protein